MVDNEFKRTGWVYDPSNAWAPLAVPWTTEHWAQVVYPVARTVSNVFVYTTIGYSLTLGDAPMIVRVEDGSGKVLMQNKVLEKTDWQKVRLNDFTVDNATTTNFVWATGLSFPSYTGTAFRLVVHKVANATDYGDMNDTVRINHILFTGNATSVLVPSPTTDPLVVTSLRNMPDGYFEPRTPYAYLQNLPDFLVGVPMSKDLEWSSRTFTFASGGIHAYGFRGANVS